MSDIKSFDQSHAPDDIPDTVAPPLNVPDTLDQWPAVRSEILQQWQSYLGSGPEKVALEPHFYTGTEENGFTRTVVSYQVEEGCRVEAFLLIPEGEGPFPAVVVYHPTNYLTTFGPAGIVHAPVRHTGVQLARAGYVALCPCNFIFRYHGLVADEHRGFTALGEITEALLNRWPKWTGMGKMVWDGLRAVDFLLTLPQVDAERLGCFGHSLGAKEALYSMAFDERLRAGVSSEGGVGIHQSNWDAPWYLGERIRHNNELDHHQLLALAAPRATLVIGGGGSPGKEAPGVSPGADTLETWSYITSARPVYRLFGKESSISYYLHDKGHVINDDVVEAMQLWFRQHLA